MSLFVALVVRLKVPDLEAAAARLGEIDWRRTAPIWSDVVREREDGTLGLTAGGGSANRRAMIKAVRCELNLDKLLCERGFEEDDESVAISPPQSSPAPPKPALGSGGAHSAGLPFRVDASTFRVTPAKRKAAPFDGFVAVESRRSACLDAVRRRS